MKGNLIIALTIFVFTSVVHSQGSTNIGINFSTGTNSFPKNGRLGLGASLEYLLPVTGGSGLKVYVAYDWFHHKVSDSDSVLLIGIRGESISMLPLRIGWQQFLYAERLFVSAAVGYNRLTSASKYNAFKGGLSYGMSGGYRFNMQNNSFFQLSALYSVNRQNKIWSYNYGSVKAAYGLNFISRAATSITRYN